jgi:hypothetical protein
MTIIIIGINRGGTSAIAASLDSLGVSLGEKSKKPIYEDIALARAFRAKEWKTFKSIVADYDATHKRWAWKLPDSINDIKRVGKLFNEKKYIFVFRDIFAIASRKKQALDQDILPNMTKANHAYGDVLKLIKKNNIDYLMVSYEKVLTEPENYATQLLEFLEQENTDENIKKICDSISISPTDYILWSERKKQVALLDKHNVTGHLSRASNNMISGWVKPKDSDKNLSVKVLYENNEIATVLADEYRDGLVKAGISSIGRHGFSYCLANAVSYGDSISVVESMSGVDLSGSPKKYTYISGIKKLRDLAKTNK